MSQGSVHEWGRVDEDGTVYVRTNDGERAVGQYPAGSPEEAMTFFTKRYEALAAEVDLLGQRVRSGVMSPEEAAESVKTVSAQVAEANAVGDLASLIGRLDSLGPVIASQREARKAEKAQRVVESKAAKEKIVAEAETLATGNDWRAGANRLREPARRVEGAAPDRPGLRRRAVEAVLVGADDLHPSPQDALRRAEREARGCARGQGAPGQGGRGARRLHRLGPDRGPLPRPDDASGRRRARRRRTSTTSCGSGSAAPRTRFFGARDAANAALDAEFAANAEVKEKLLVEAEALLPVTDLDAAKKHLRDLADRWDAAGKVPRDRMKELEGRMRAVEQAVRSIEDERWRASDPEKSARADDMVSKLEAAIAKAEADLEKARAAGNDKKVAELEADLTSRRSFLDMAKQVSADYSDPRARLQAPAEPRERARGHARDREATRCERNAVVPASSR